MLRPAEKNWIQSKKNYNRWTSFLVDRQSQMDTIQFGVHIGTGTDNNIQPDIILRWNLIPHNNTREDIIGNNRSQSDYGEYRPHQMGIQPSLTESTLRRIDQKLLPLRSNVDLGGRPESAAPRAELGALRPQSNAGSLDRRGRVAFLLFWTENGYTHHPN